MDSVKQSAALCLLRLYKASPDLVPMGEWTARVVHLLNDQHMVRPLSHPGHPRAPEAPCLCLRHHILLAAWGPVQCPQHPSLTPPLREHPAPVSDTQRGPHVPAPAQPA